MSEAAAAAAPPDEHTQQVFYCHMCNIKFESRAATFQCPRCSDGFIEVMEPQSEGDAITTTTSASDFTQPTEYASDSDDEMFDVFLRQFNFLLPDVRPTGNRNRRRDGGSSGGVAHAAGNNSGRPSQAYDNLFQEFIVNLGVNMGVNMMGANGNMQLFLNPGDYAWGREGLDAILTQLLNQIDTTGPPPLAQDVIDAIPIVEVNQHQVDTKQKCSVCWEEFRLNEKVRQLACQHIYHEPCIRPWLELHSTCPICRQNLGSDDQATNPANDSTGGGIGGVGGIGVGGGGTYNALQQLFQVVQGSSALSGSASSDTSSGNESITSTSSGSGSSNTSHGGDTIMSTSPGSASSHTSNGGDTIMSTSSNSSSGSSEQ